MRAEVREAGIAKRQARAALRHEVRTGMKTIAEVLTDPPRDLWEVPTYRILGWAPGVGPDRLAVLNQEAIRAEVNLLMPVIVLTSRERSWLVDILSRRP